MSDLCEIHLLSGTSVKATLRAQIKDKDGNDYFVVTCDECKEVAELFVQMTLPLMEALNDSRK